MFKNKESSEMMSKITKNLLVSWLVQELMLLQNRNNLACTIKRQQDFTPINLFNQLSNGHYCIRASDLMQFVNSESEALILIQRISPGMY